MCSLIEITIVSIQTGAKIATIVPACFFYCNDVTKMAYSTFINRWATAAALGLVDMWFEYEHPGSPAITRGRGDIRWQYVHTVWGKMITQILLLIKSTSTLIVKNFSKLQATVVVL